MSESLVATAMIAYLLGTVVLILIGHRRGIIVSEVLRSEHPAHFERLGRPKPSFSDWASNSRFDRFILGRSYKELSDPRLTSLCDSLRTLDMFVIAVIAGAVTLILRLLYVAHAA